MTVRIIDEEAETVQDGSVNLTPKIIHISLTVRVDGGTLGHQGAKRIVQAAARAAENAVPSGTYSHEVSGSYTHGHLYGTGEIITR